MANRYWVGGTATWNSSAGTKWSTTSGGAGGSAVPTIADDVFLDASSGSVTVTIQTATAVCRTLNTTGFTGTLSIGASNMTLGGNLTFGSSTSISGTGTITCNGTATFTFNNPTFAGTTFSSIPSLILSNSTATYTFSTNTTWGLFTYTTGTLNAQNTTIELRRSTSDWSSTTAAKTANVQGTTVVLKGDSILSLPASNLTINSQEMTIASGGKHGLTSYRTIVFRAANNVIGNVDIWSGSSLLILHTGATNTNIVANNINFTGSGGTLTVNTGTSLTINNNINTLVGGASNLNIISTQDAMTTFGKINAASGSKTLNWFILRDTVFSGGATFTANNSYDIGNNSGISITAPSSSSIAFSPIKG